MGASATAAINIIGKSRDEYQCNQVVNQILFCKKDIGMLANDYRTWGVETSIKAEGVVVVGKDGKHVGVFINDYEFVHSSMTRQQVIVAPLEQLHHVFKHGYMLRKAY